MVCSASPIGPCSNLLKIFTALILHVAVSPIPSNRLEYIFIIYICSNKLLTVLNVSHKSSSWSSLNAFTPSVEAILSDCLLGIPLRSNNSLYVLSPFPNFIFLSFISFRNVEISRYLVWFYRLHCLPLLFKKIVKEIYFKRLFRCQCTHARLWICGWWREMRTWLEMKFEVSECVCVGSSAVVAKLCFTSTPNAYYKPTRESQAQASD